MPTKRGLQITIWLQKSAHIKKTNQTKCQKKESWKMISDFRETEAKKDEQL